MTAFISWLVMLKHWFGTGTGSLRYRYIMNLGTCKLLKRQGPILSNLLAIFFKALCTGTYGTYPNPYLVGLPIFRKLTSLEAFSFAYNLPLLRYKKSSIQKLLFQTIFFYKSIKISEKTFPSLSDWSAWKWVDGWIMDGTQKKLPLQRIFSKIYRNIRENFFPASEHADTGPLEPLMWGVQVGAHCGEKV